MSLANVRTRIIILFLACWNVGLLEWPVFAEETVASSTAFAASAAVSDAPPVETPASFEVRGYYVDGPVLPPEQIAVVGNYLGTNLSMTQLAQAAAALQSAYRNYGYLGMSVVVSSQPDADGVIAMNVNRGAVPQIVVAGQRYVISTNGVAAAPPLTAAEYAAAAEETARQAAIAATNQVGPTFEVQKYLITGNTLLPPEVMSSSLTNASGAFGTNVSFTGIEAARNRLQQTYQERGYASVAVTVPPQSLTNATVKLQVVQGTLAAINVTGNQYFNSNNVMRALPGLRTNMILNSLTLQNELNRANANQDRTIYPVIGPGPDPGTTELTLNVKDKMPLHGKFELNNQNTVNTPELRMNMSGVYQNLWQREHALGLQYGFSPTSMKASNEWHLYDQPLIANYSGFYRLPLGNPEATESVMAAQPGAFGYSEAQRRFILPPPSGPPELTVFASRSTMDTDLQKSPEQILLDEPGVRRITRQDVQQDLTINESFGYRLSKPIRGTEQFSSGISQGLERKSYSLTSYKTNNFTLTEITYGPDGRPNPPVVSTVSSPVPPTVRELDYLPLTFGYNANWRLPRAMLAFGLGVGINTWYSGERSDLQTLTGSKKSTGHWVTLDPSLSADITVWTNWILSVRADGRWASEPLISNEQFGAGGVASVRGYHEGEVFGDTGWHFSLEQKTPPYVLGLVGGKYPLTVRGSLYTDFASTYLLDPQGRDNHTTLWSVGMGTVASIGSYWEARLFFSLPLQNAGTVERYEPFFNFSLTAQF